MQQLWLSNAASHIAKAMDLPYIKPLRAHTKCGYLQLIFFPNINSNLKNRLQKTTICCLLPLFTSAGHCPFLNVLPKHAHFIIIQNLSRSNFLPLHPDMLLSARLKSSSIIFLFPAEVPCTLSTHLSASLFDKLKSSCFKAWFPNC